MKSSKPVLRRPSFGNLVASGGAMKDFKISPQLASKLASVVVHAEEAISVDGHPFDKTALEQAVNDPEVVAWIKTLGPLAPVKR